MPSDAGLPKLTDDQIELLLRAADRVRAGDATGDDRACSRAVQALLDSGLVPGAALPGQETELAERLALADPRLAPFVPELATLYRAALDPALREIGKRIREIRERMRETEERNRGHARLYLWTQGLLVFSAVALVGALVLLRTGPPWAAAWAELVGAVAFVGALYVRWAYARWLEEGQVAAGEGRKPVDAFLAAPSREPEGQDVTEVDRRFAFSRLAKTENSYAEWLYTYHTTTVQRARLSFGWALATAVLGFGLIGGIVCWVLISKESDGSRLAAMGGLGAVGAALSGYIANTLLAIHRMSLEQLRSFFEEPSRMIRLTTAWRIAQTLPVDDTERTRILGEVTAAMVREGAGTALRPVPPPPEGGGGA